MSNEKVHWEDSYAIGIRYIDDQHKKLFDLVNKLYDLKDNANIKEEIREILYAFRDYTIIHFKDEEEYMKSISYPKLQEHKHKHKKIIDSLVQIINTPATLGIIKTKMRVIAKRVLVDHIVEEDHKIALFKQNNIISEEVFALDDLVSD